MAGHGEYYRVEVTVMLRSVLNLIVFSTVIRILFTKIKELTFIILCLPKDYQGLPQWLVILLGQHNQ